MIATHAAPVRVTAASFLHMRRALVGECIYNIGEAGIAWRVVSGAIRLDRVAGENRSFAGLARAGDVIGAETLLFRAYSFEARALTDCELEPWLARGNAPSRESLLQMLAAAESRAADALALRAGEAFERVRKLIMLLAGERGHAAAARVGIPALKDMAEMTGLTVETVSRAMSHLRWAGVLKREGRRSGLVFPENLQLQ